MPTATDQIQDTVIALEALITDMLAKSHNKESAKKIVADYKLKHNQATVKEREKAEEAARVSRATGLAKRDFTEKLSNDYWTLEVLSDKQRKDHINKVWQSLVAEHELPEDTNIPAYDHQQASFEQLIMRKAELEALISTANLSQAEEAKAFAENAKASYKQAMEEKLRVRLAELNRMTGMSDGDREQLIASAKQDCKLSIARHASEQDRAISTSKVTFARVENAKRELNKLNTLIKKSI